MNDTLNSEKLSKLKIDEDWQAIAMSSAEAADESRQASRIGEH